MADQTQRLEIATVRAEIGGNIVYHFANDPAANSPIPTDSGSIPNLKQVVAQIQEDGAEKISIATTIYQSPAAGLAATAADGIFLVQSADADTIYTVWKNQAGAAVNTGKKAMSSQAVQTALDASNEAAQAAENAADIATARTAGFLGSASEPPTVRDNGLPLQFGDRYFNTNDQAEYIYKSGGWLINDSQEAVDNFQNRTDPQKGASLLGWDGGSVGEQLNLSKNVPSYNALRAYSGPLTKFRIVADGMEGSFVKKAFASGDVDNGGTLLVSTSGAYSFHRVVSGKISSRWFGAVLDGITDDSSAIQAAINAAPAGSTVEIAPSAAGCVASGLVVNKKVHIVADEGALKQKAATDAPFITFLGVTGFRAKGLRIDGNRANQLSQVSGIEIKGCSGFQLNDVEVFDAKYCGVLVEANTDVHPSKSYLRNVKCPGSGYSGILIYEGTRLDIINCSGTNNDGFGLAYDGTKEESGSDINISGGDYDHNGYSGILFPYLNYTTLKGRCGKVRISNVSACYNGQNGITLQGKDKQIIGSTINNNGLSGVLVNGQQCTVNSNELKFNGSVGVDWGDCEDITCVGNQAIGNGDMGIEVNSCLRGVVSGNTVNGNNTKVNILKAGIVLQLGAGGYPFTGPTSSIAVTGNYVGPGPNQDYGILLTADTSGCYVDANVASNSGAVQDIRCISSFNIVRPGACRASHMASPSQITVATAATVTIPDAAEVVFLTGTVNVSTITCGNLYPGRELTLIFNSSTPSILNTGNILSSVSPVATWRPIYLTYIKSIDKWAVMETKTF
ncbi:right-handed parallel beta-helix repeat-containing protein [Pseudomonas syringae pv. tagetis]|nr:right-handed parallel beta-helix repeat-containing protein [Pseudomonas syringae group genomosp. 7]RMW18325.1 hypothetical protein ALO97_01182 [Pseudomonas syringae pv. tagetis]UNB69495.1 right-handed parallel beta-helix repeat-containing protein [Pseudomonas syringae pv. tagetis]